MQIDGEKAILYISALFILIILIGTLIAQFSDCKWPLSMPTFGLENRIAVYG